MSMNVTVGHVLTENVRMVLTSTPANVRKASRGSTVSRILMNVSAIPASTMVGTAGYEKTTQKLIGRKVCCGDIFTYWLLEFYKVC